MGKINVLSFAVANLIAAGEVVDRPSSVIKELLENAIDSGADSITVEIQNGGVTYMRVTDNGCGISKEDLPVAIRRHATSKIKNAEDLNGILTLGFRGEALAAIASVSDMRIISKQKESANGAMLEASGGNIIGVTDRPAADGTTVIVENLFANVPARKKFLKKDVTEAMSVSAVVEKIALSRPDIFFKLIIDGNVKIETTGDGSLKNTVYAVFGREFASKLIEAKLSSEGITVRGFIGRPDNIRANRNYQNFFINGRYVKSRTAAAALEQAYTSYIASEKFPCCILFMDIDPSLVDVNV
ncbi:MAG: DNA mismatch repair endonuclease MutL, partial [Clostridia bacterium]|nr:DNA mismatch repair endonuclease MutL [Clostridia bacterium]